jgi:predicted RecB family nuclease
MDSLALLCTLHADGPATWRKLRENGCHKLTELARFDPERLAAILGGTPAGARRFLREARHLGERSGSAWLEREEPLAAASPGLAAPSPVVAEEVPLPARDQALVEDVLRAWRDEDHKELETRAPPAPAPEPLFEPEPAFELVPIASLAVARAAQALAPNLVDGLSQAACEQLRAEGVHTLEALVEADLGQLALRSGLGYSRLYRWRSLAERQLRTERAQAPAREELRLSPAEIPAPAEPRDLLEIPARGLDLPRRTPRWTPLEEGAAGPFA